MFCILIFTASQAVQKMRKVATVSDFTVRDCSTCPNAAYKNPDMTDMEFQHTPCAKCKRWEPENDNNTAQMPPYWWDKYTGNGNNQAGR